MKTIAVYGEGEVATEIADMSAKFGIDVVLHADSTDSAAPADVDLAIAVIAAKDASGLRVGSGVPLPANVIGLHFRSPVADSSLVEIVRGERIPDEVVARAFDYVAQLNKLAIVVEADRGLFTPRITNAFVSEAVSLLADGVHPASIEQSATQVGFPAGGLLRADELGIEECLAFRDEVKIAVESRGNIYISHPVEKVFEKLVELGRVGAAKGAGFYDYDESGNRVALWPGLTEHFPVQGNPADVDLKTLSERQLVIGSIEAARCIEERVVTHAAEANIGSIHGSGSPLWTGGVLQYVNSFPGGVTGFVARADELAAEHGERFSPNALLRSKSKLAGAF